MAGENPLCITHNTRNFYKLKILNIMKIIDIDYINRLDLETQFKIFNLVCENLCISSVEKASEILFISKQALYKKTLIEIDKVKLVPVNLILQNKKEPTF